jgi:hypothetical protein
MGKGESSGSNADAAGKRMTYQLKVRGVDEDSRVEDWQVMEFDSRRQRDEAGRVYRDAGLEVMAIDVEE